MAVTILERPEGHILEATSNTSTASESYGAGDAQFVSITVHGLVDGDFIYAESDIEDYAGFWYVDAISTGIFKIKRYVNGSYVQFIADGTITWYKASASHGWSAVHLPITYLLSNNLFPVNSSDTTRNITSVQNANGQTVLLLSGSLGSGVNSFDYVKITLPNDTDLSGVYQIIEFVSPTVIIINLAYDSANNFTSATALKHYNNYNIQVRVYAGINASHEWAAQKPYEIATTLNLTPDSNNQVFFSVNEILKSYIETRNNLTLGTLPNNIDFWANFYIEIAESYDDSDGYAFGMYVSPFTSDQVNFEGTAVNAQLEFKNIYSGYLSEYLMTNNTAKFLTLFTVPVIFSCSTSTPNCYTDISWLNPNNNATIIIRKEFYSNGNGPVTIDDTITTDSGVIRTELGADCDYDRVDLTILISPPEVEALADWLQTVTSAVNWTLGANPSVTLDPTSTNQSEQLYSDFAGVNGVTYTFDYDIDTDNGFQVLTVGFLDSGGATLANTVENLFGVSNVGQISVTNSSGTIDRVFIQVSTLGAVGPVRTIDINSFDLDSGSGDEVISETKQFLIDCGCAQQEIRLTWLNNLGGFEYWNFTGKKDHIVEIQQALVTKKNIIPQWPKSYGAQADTIRKQTLRVSNKAYTIRAQHLTQDQADAIDYIKSSVLAQIINSRTDRRTVIVDSESFIKYQDQDKLYTIAFNVSFTDDIPSQSA